MTNERRKILDMLAAGQITAEQADRLLAALERGTAEATGPETAGGPSKPAPKYIRVMVDGTDRKDGGPVHVNMRVPIALLRAGVRLASFIPPPAQQRMNEALREKGVNVDVTQIKPENVNELIEQLRDLTIDVDHTGVDADHRHDDVKVKIYAE